MRHVEMMQRLHGPLTVVPSCVCKAAWVWSVESRGAFMESSEPQGQKRALGRCDELDRSALLPAGFGHGTLGHCCATPYYPILAM